MSNTNDKQGKVGSFFAKIKWKNILTFSFFLILASIFWLMQVYRQKFETTRFIPIKYVNIPENIVFSRELPPMLSIKIKDDGASLLRYNLTRYQDTLIVDIAERLNKGLLQIKGQDFEDLIQTKIFSSSEIINYLPTEIDCSYEAMHKKRLPVIYSGKLDLAEGYILDGEITLLPDSVSAYGSKRALDTLSFAYTTTDTIKELSSSSRLDIKLQDVKGVFFRPLVVNLNVPIDKFTMKTIEVPIQCINLPETRDIKIFPSAVKIQCSVGLNRYDRISASDFLVTIDYNHLKRLDKKGASIPVNIAKGPNYVVTKMPIPAEVEFVLEQK